MDETPDGRGDATGESVASRRERLRRCRDAVWASPGFAGMVAAAVMAFIIRMQPRDADLFLIANYVANGVLGGLGSAAAVMWLHPDDRGRRWRAVAAFAFGFVCTLPVAFGFGCLFVGMAAK